MKKFIPMVVVAACVASVAFASIRQPAATVSTQTQYAVVDTVPAQQEDTTAPAQQTPATPADTGTTTDTSSVSY